MLENKHSKQQFNVYLEPNLILAVKHRAIDDQMSLSDFTTKALAFYLEAIKMNANSPQIKLQPMVHVRSMEESVRFYEALGGKLLTGSRDGDWAKIGIGNAEISLLAHPPNREQNEAVVELNFETDEPLGAVQKMLEAAGVEIVRGAADEAFGEQLQLASPDGLLIKINRLDPRTFQ